MVLAPRKPGSPLKEDRPAEEAQSRPVPRCTPEVISALKRQSALIEAALAQQEIQRQAHAKKVAETTAEENLKAFEQEEVRKAAHRNELARIKRRIDWLGRQ